MTGKILLEFQTKMAPTRYILLYVGIAIAALAVRFYQLGDINKPVFDEIYFPKFAYHYIQQQPFFHSHPPLAKYTMQGAIALYHALPWVNEPALGTVDFSQLNPVSYRWGNATLGFFAAIFFAYSAWRLTKSHLFTVIVFAFVGLDGALIVSSRFGLSNVHIQFWGGLSVFLALLTVQTRNWLYPLLLGISLGCVACIKWSGLSYWAMSIALCSLIYLVKLLQVNLASNSWLKSGLIISSPMRKSLLPYLFCLTLIPALTYSVLWLPDLQLNTKFDFVQTHQQFFSYHNNRVAEDAHPYCSKWYSWPLMQRPISYHFEKLPINEQAQACYKNVHSFANPLLYWWSSFAVLFMCFYTVYKIRFDIKHRILTNELVTCGVILLGYFANWLPWALVSRCTFLYHYQSAAIFSFMSLAYLLCLLHKTNLRLTRVLFVIILVSIFLSFVYWLPFQLGIPLEKSAFYQRMWFNSWI
ncbi:dolichyl-phosphate-mannose--protein O-mannosyl transferase [Catenovulum agarivorans DS-2]|uniref:Polyprenol-phosphate-mannose--protein mannosyltransferase n=1 Tax=Catenovulum agarivorans DS-2 TaxID=1328313 RepID=W7R2L7_9ALTE|nr:phospholipid carrier-dependent glycosyltransferase [Catenovulum agarivorans]EWH11875.1 dolichyl-phosphate-mannose--protein O-mannosyl transferase [Catenovulum agarivorans DS-2]